MFSGSVSGSQEVLGSAKPSEAKTMPEIRVIGEPVPKERPRRGRNGQWYTPERTRMYEELVGWTWRQTRLKPIPGPLVVRLEFILAKRDKDLDNLVKSVLDGLNGVAWQDDSQIVHLAAGKTKGKSGQVLIQVERLV